MEKRKFDNKKLLEFFIEFLKSKYILGKFEKNLKEEANLDIDKFKKLDEKFIKHGLRDMDLEFMDAPPLIAYGFVWSQTDEGFEFWCNIEDEFITHFKENYHEV